MIRFATFLCAWLIGIFALSKLVFPIFLAAGFDRPVISLLIALVLVGWTAGCTIVGVRK